MWSTLCNIPPQVAGDAVLPMFTLIDLVCLDSAVVHTGKRVALHDIFKNCGSPVSLGKERTLNVKSLQWLFNRGFRVHNFEIGLLDVSLLEDHIDLVQAGVLLNCNDSRELGSRQIKVLRQLTTKIDGLYVLSSCKMAALSALTELVHNLRSLTVVHRDPRVNTPADPGAFALIQQLFMNNCLCLNMLSVTDPRLFAWSLPDGYHLHALTKLTVHLRAGDSADDRALETLASLCRHLRVLAIISEQLGEDSRVDRGITAFAHCNSGLQDVSVYATLTALSVRTLAFHCAQLRSLSIKHVSGFCLEMAQALALHCPLLVSLSWHWDFVYSDVDMDTLRCVLERLEELTLPCFISSFEGLTKVLGCCSRLRELSHSADGRANDYTLEAMQALATTCTQLRVVRNLSCGIRTRHVLNDLVARNAHLRELHLSAWTCPYGDDLLFALGQHCSSFEKLTIISKTVTFTDAGITALAIGCPNLQLLTLHYGPAITDQALFALAQHCHAQLTHVFLQRCVQVTEAGALRLIQCCSRLRVLLLNRRHFSRPFEQLVRKKYRRVRLTLSVWDSHAMEDTGQTAAPNQQGRISAAVSSVANTCVVQ